MKKIRKAKVNIEIGLNENNIAETISWLATDYSAEFNKARAMILSMWDGEKNEALSIDMWTKEMTIEEMKFFVFQTLLKMTELIKKSTGEEELALEMRKFVKKFGSISGIIKK
tara:strand:- start:725 stop:1063 length:339 start_codon:yes stop_codon:yes gene_type:complete